MPDIHPLALVDANAQIHDDVVVGPFCYIEGDTIIGKGTRLESHVTIKRFTEIGENNYVAQGAVLGGDPQDNKFLGERSFLKVGHNNIIREYVTLHRATGEDRVTSIGDHCFIMAYCHVGHNCTVMDRVTMANSVGVAGYVMIEERATIGGMCGIHQFCRIGKVSMVGGFSKITRDVPPFVLIDGADALVKDINAVGLRRIGITADDRLALHKACKLLYKSQLGTKSAIEIIMNEVPMTEEIQYLLAFEHRRSLGRNGRGDQR